MIDHKTEISGHRKLTETKCLSLSLSPPCPLCSLWPSRRWASGLTQQSQLHRAHAPLARGSGPVWTPGDISLEGGGGIPSHPTPPPFLLSLGGKLWAYPNLPLPFLRNKGTNPWKIIYRLIDRSRPPVTGEGGPGLYLHQESTLANFHLPDVSTALHTLKCICTDALIGSLQQIR